MALLHSGGASFALCQAGCSSVAIACYTLQGFVLDTTFIPQTTPSEAPYSIFACNAAMASCMTACYAWFGVEAAAVHVILLHLSLAVYVWHEVWRVWSCEDGFWGGPYPSKRPWCPLDDVLGSHTDYSPPPRASEDPTLKIYTI